MVARCHSGSEDGCRGRRRRRQRKTLLIYIPEFEECSRSSPPQSIPLSVRPPVPKERLLVIAVLLKICRAANGSFGRRQSGLRRLRRHYVPSRRSGRKDLLGMF